MFRQLFLVNFLIVLYSALCGGQVLQFGACPEIDTMKYFDIEEFQGRWYEILRFPIWYEQYGDCAYKRIQYCGRRLEIEHVFVKDGVQFVLHLNTTYVPGDDAIFVIRESNIDPVGIPMNVVLTDYDNYAIVYGCKYSEAMGLKYISAWILSRRTTLPEAIMAKVNHELRSLPYANTAYFEEVDQSNEKCASHWTAHVQAVNYNGDL
ncbi:lopap [Helicoverpa armigera]|uniref:lopap n=1 Tax=Helicoverpa armigera TaxID=29058 RepID=UPI0030828341